MFNYGLGELNTVSQYLYIMVDQQKAVCQQITSCGFKQCYRYPNTQKAMPNN